MVRFGILTASDRASKGVYDDLSGVAIEAILKEWVITPFEIEYKIIADEKELIEKTLLDMASSCDAVFTTGGTGPAARDVTPEATEAVCEKMMPGFGEVMRAASLKYVPTAILSRQTAGICGKCLIVNLPGQPKAIRECMEPIFAAIPYCLDLIGAGFVDTDPEKIKTFRPKKK